MYGDDPWLEEQGIPYVLAVKSATPISADTERLLDASGGRGGWTNRYQRGAGRF